MFKAIRQLVELKHKLSKGTSWKPNPAYHPSLWVLSTPRVKCTATCMHGAPRKGTRVSKWARNMPRHKGSSSSKSLIPCPVANLVNSPGQRSPQAARSQSLAGHGIPKTSWRVDPPSNLASTAATTWGPRLAGAHELEHERGWLAVLAA